jgi:predicted dienelactone hydrolase
MRLSSFMFVAIALCLAATLAQAAGFRVIDADGPALKGAMWYPCSQPPGEIQVGLLTLPGVKNCPISGDKLPLVVISHGSRGSLANQHDTAGTLADAGFSGRDQSSRRYHLLRYEPFRR